MLLGEITEHYAQRRRVLNSSDQVYRSDGWGNFLVCFVPMLTFVDVEIIGRVFLSELLLLFMLPFLLLMRGELLLSTLPKRLFFLGLIWLLSQILTDVILATPFEDWSRGWSKIVFLMLNFAAIYLLIHNKPKRFVWFAVGAALGHLLSYFFNPTLYAEANPWKWGVGTPLTVLTIIAVQHKFFEWRQFLANSIIVGMGAVNFYMGYRSIGLICFLVAGYLFVTKISSNNFGIKVSQRTLPVLLTLIGGVSIYLVAGVYEYAATNLWLGEDALEKYESQAYGDFGTLLGGRSEILASFRAIMDSPIIGHGSWARDPRYVQFLQENLLKRGYELQGEYLDDLIPSHSYIFGSWVEAGICGAIFWLWALYVTIRALLQTQASERNLPLMAFVAFNLLWAIPFSPFAGGARLDAAFSLCMMMFYAARSGPSTTGTNT